MSTLIRLFGDYFSEYRFFDLRFDLILELFFKSYTRVTQKFHSFFLDSYTSV